MICFFGCREYDRDVVSPALGSGGGRVGRPGIAAHHTHAHAHAHTHHNCTPPHVCSSIRDSVSLSVPLPTHSPIVVERYINTFCIFRTEQVKIARAGSVPVCRPVLPLNRPTWRARLAPRPCLSGHWLWQPVPTVSAPPSLSASLGTSQQARLCCRTSTAASRPPLPLLLLPPTRTRAYCTRPTTSRCPSTIFIMIVCMNHT